MEEAQEKFVKQIEELKDNGDSVHINTNNIELRHHSDDAAHNFQHFHNGANEGLVSPADVMIGVLAAGENSSKKSQSSKRQPQQADSDGNDDEEEEEAEAEEEEVQEDQIQASSKHLASKVSSAGGDKLGSQSKRG